MAREYKYSAVYKVGLLLAMLLSFYGGIELGKSYGYVIALVVIASISYFVLLIVKYKIIITDEYIVVDIGKLGKRFERKWEKIYRVSRVPFVFLWMYRIDCRDMPSLTFISSITNYKDLLKEIVERSPNAIVDDSIKKLLEPV